MELKNKNIKDLEIYAEEIRKLLIDVVSKNGGHLAPNLGVVELTIAMHYVFNSPKDMILWDVGHQSYVHKILTGRKDKINTIRKRHGLSPFTNPKESEHDHFIAGHAGNTLSAAYGIAEAKKDSKVLAVLGDASLANGVSLEALNNMGGKAKNVIVVLNDNEMSIGENVGALSKNLSKMMSTKFYNKLKEEVETTMRKVKIGNPVADVIRRIEHSVRYFFYPGSLFEGLGFKYIGPIDGHNLNALITTFKSAESLKGPIFIHVKTQKGKGYAPAEENQEKFHGISPFDKETGKTKCSLLSYSKVFGDLLLEKARGNKDILAIVAGMIKGTGLSTFAKELPEQIYDVGIAEEHAVSFAGGLAIKGKKPVVAIYSTFLQRCFDQMIHDISLQNLAVLFMIDRAGIVGEDGETHQGVFDISYMLSVPNVVVLAPTTMKELEKSISFGLEHTKGPISIRIPRSNCLCSENEMDFEFGKWNEVKKGSSDLIIAVGSMLREVLEVQNSLEEKGVKATIVSANFLRPFDEEYLLKNISKYENIHTLEEGVEKNSFGTSIIEFLNDNKILKKVNRIGIKNAFIPHGKRDELMEEIGLKGDKLVERILEGR